MCLPKRYVTQLKMVSVDPGVASRLVDDLAKQHYSIQPNMVPPALVQRLRATFRDRVDEFRPAKVGRSDDSSLLPDIRNDEICWINNSSLRDGEAELFQIFEMLRLTLNRELFLGLTDFEAHYARYDEGHFYARHLDRFQADGARQISVVVYLNEDWVDADGGALRLYADPHVDVQPLAGTLVCFTSAEIEHEVLPAKRERTSIAAWFRRS
jgi:SM-20-related protein